MKLMYNHHMIMKKKNCNQRKTSSEKCNEYKSQKSKTL